MSSQPLRVALLWHQHQPYYKTGNSYLLPWTRLHATKDYYDIAAALEGFPNVRQTINVVPSLLVQLVDYVENDATDAALTLSRRPAANLTDAEKLAILRSFFLCNAERMILPYPRYAELFARGGGGNRDDMPRLQAAAAAYTVQDWLDLQVWYNLTWIGEYSRHLEPFASLLRKGSRFTESEKLRLLEASLTIVAKVIPTYRRMMESGQIELSVTPFYHPILPVLCDSYSALEALPALTLPEHHIRFPEDATVHLERAVAMFRRQFGRDPNGMWPSEGSVSDEALNLVRSAGLSWTATDEGVLRRTLGEGWHSLSKYFPYTVRTKSGPLWVLFRDHELSDTIGFVYSNWKPQDAASDFYYRLVEIRNRIIQERGMEALGEALVPVILDGENCWEYYQNNGRPFLESLYRLLNDSNEIVTTTIHDALETQRASRERTLGRVFSGSWIGTNFKIWIGHEEDNAAWDALVTAREHLMRVRDSLTEEVFDEAMEEIYIAEDTDWFWWFGDENSSANQDDFDELFRYHLRRVYTLIGEEPPAGLDLPIRRASRHPRVVPPSGPITPTIEGVRTSLKEWSNAGHFVVEQVGGAMHRADAFERRIWFGRDDASFFLRFDTTLPLLAGESIRLTISGRRSMILTFSAGAVAIAALTDDHGKVAISGMAAAAGDTLEASIPLSHLDGEGENPESIGIVCEIYEHGHEIERFPHQGQVVCPLVWEAKGR